MEEVTPIAGIGLGVTALVLLIACANVGNLLLARGVDRRREMSVRMAIGAGRPRLVRQLLTEALLLGLVASAGGVLFALWTGDVLASQVPDLPVRARIDANVFAFSVAAAVVVAIATGLAPAWFSTRESLSATLKATSPGLDVHRARVQSASVVCQVAVSVVLLVMAALFLRSLDKAAGIDMGFDTSRRVLAATVDLGLQPGGAEGIRAAGDALVERAASLPGVVSASLTSAMPAAEWVRLVVQVPTADGASRRMGTSVYSVRPAFFDTIGMPLLRGRDFTDADTSGAEGVVIVNEAIARGAWPDADPIGQRIVVEGAGYPWFTVIGVARQARPDIQSANEPAVFFAHRQYQLLSRTTLLVRAAADATPLAPSIRRLVAEVDPQLAISRLQTLDQLRNETVGNRRAGAGVLGAAGVLGLLLATIGIAGGMALGVSQRTREIGIRLALGAAPALVARYFVRRGMRLALLGIVVGTIAALAVSQAVASMLFGITARDAIAYAGVAALLAAVALVACWYPARRIAAVDPLKALAGD